MVLNEALCGGRKDSQGLGPGLALDVRGSPPPSVGSASLFCGSC